MGQQLLFSQVELEMPLSCLLQGQAALRQGGIGVDKSAKLTEIYLKKVGAEEVCQELPEPAKPQCISSGEPPTPPGDCSASQFPTPFFYPDHCRMRLSALTSLLTPGLAQPPACSTSLPGLEEAPQTSVPETELQPFPW